MAIPLPSTGFARENNVQANLPLSGVRGVGSGKRKRITMVLVVVVVIKILIVFAVVVVSIGDCVVVGLLPPG